MENIYFISNNFFLIAGTISNTTGPTANKSTAESENILPADWSSVITKTEFEILKLMAKYKHNKEIGDILCMSHHTVKSHAGNIYSKMKVHSRLEAIMKAKFLGWLD